MLILSQYALNQSICFHKMWATNVVFTKIKYFQVVLIHFFWHSTNKIADKSLNIVILSFTIYKKKSSVKYEK